MRSLGSIIPFSVAISSLGFAQCPQDDAQEPNDDCASFISIATSGPITPINATVTGSSDDYWGFLINPGLQLAVLVTTNGGSNSIAVELLDSGASCALIATSSSNSGNSIVVRNTTTTPMLYVARVFLSSGTCIAYTLDATIGSAFGSVLDCPCDSQASLLVNGGAESGTLTDWNFVTGLWGIWPASGGSYCVAEGQFSFSAGQSFTRFQDVNLIGSGFIPSQLDSNPPWFEFESSVYADFATPFSSYEVTIEGRAHDGTLLDSSRTSLPIVGPQFRRAPLRYRPQVPGVRILRIEETGFLISGGACIDSGVLRACALQQSQDCNGNAIEDTCEVSNGYSPDLNINGVPDECEPDCNMNGTPDDIDILEGVSIDANQDGIPDSCQIYSDVCFGDGGNGLGCTPCPCGNESTAGTVGGCINPDGRSARLLAAGIPSASADSMRFTMTGGSSQSFGILTSASFLAPANAINPCFGLDSGIQSPALDGLRCVVQQFQRHGTRALDSMGDVGLSNPGWGPPNGPPGGLIQQGAFVAGQTRHYQVLYRVDIQGGCGLGANTTQAVSITFQP